MPETRAKVVIAIGATLIAVAEAFKILIFLEFLMIYHSRNF
ncbi:MAG: hypothetical protein ACP5GI_05715 [Sulfolobales archaeon]